MQKFLAGLCIASIAIFCLPSLDALLIFDRAAVAAGQWWRLVSCSLVHLSPSHLFLNLAAIAITALWAAQCSYRAALCVFLLVAASSGFFIWMARPDLHYFGGLSGVATALFVYANLQALGGATQRWLHAGIVAAVVLKTLSELLFDASLANTIATQPFSPVPAVHAIGIAGAFAVYAFEHIARLQGGASLHLLPRNETP